VSIKAATKPINTEIKNAFILIVLKLFPNFWGQIT
jgi:hypothetical protein